ncbi:hypothetical protein DLM78_20305 [Leptospira stimsonii]|uniref:Uncharacterized protein n=1 Tax=Leptospira stimsonii TaxID=2202203 RepID=A0A8B3CKV6_9LEPT|nr:hypothetical protein DLM78_20305 [Leptospira stimsonii]
MIRSILREFRSTWALTSSLSRWFRFIASCGIGFSFKLFQGPKRFPFLLCAFHKEGFIFRIHISFSLGRVIFFSVNRRDNFSRFEL